MKYKILRFCSLISILIIILSGCTVNIDKIIIENIPTLNVGDTYKITYSVEPDNTTDKTVSFETSDKNIATVDDQGIIKALAPGEVEISVVPKNDKKGSTTDTKSKIIITIIQPVESINCKSEMTIAVGSNQSIDAKVLPENSSDKHLIYKSSDESVIKIDENGIITGLKNGNATVTITSRNGVTTECKITIKQPVTSVKLNKAKLNLTVNETETIKPTFIPKDSDLNTEITFSSSNNSVVTVNTSGKITAVSPGNATITATVKDVNGNLLTATCEVQVSNKKTPNSIPKTSSSTSQSSSKSSDPSKTMPELEPPKVCGGCFGSGYMLTGVPCYLCDAGKGK